MSLYLSETTAFMQAYSYGLDRRSQETAERARAEEQE